jgi:hypothetical protein
VVPADGARAVAPAEPEGGFAVGRLDAEHVVAEVARHEKAVFGAQRKVYLRAQVVEVELVVAQVLVGRKFEEQVAVGPAAGHDERTLVLLDGPFQREAARHRADAPQRTEPLGVAFLHANVEQRRQAAAVLGRNAALDELDVL